MRALPHFMDLGLVLVTIAVACERSPRAGPIDTARVVAQRSTPAADGPPPVVAWDPSAGPVMLVRSGATDAASIVLPQYSDSTIPDTPQLDRTSIRSTPIELIGHNGKVGTATVAQIAVGLWDADSCIEWPTAHLHLPADSVKLSGWTVGFEHQGIAAVHLDSIDQLSAADSAQIAVELARIASALPNDTIRIFRGLPFAVRAAYRFSAAPGIEALVADVVRKLNQEATPLEQHVFLIAERDSSNRTSQYHAVYHERSGGPEETLETTDVLAAVRFAQSSETALVLVREGADTNAYTLLERDATGMWRVRWTSAHTGC